MKSITSQLPTVLGSFAAMLVAFLGLMNGTPATSCLIKASAAYVVFAGLGLIVRYAIAEAMEKSEEDHANATSDRDLPGGLDVIVPGTSVADLLAAQNSPMEAGVTDLDNEHQNAA